MAAIDKIYGTVEQRSELEKWLTENLPEGLHFLYPEWHTEKVGAISNFPSWVDIVLYRFCPLQWVKDAITEQYDGCPDIDVCSI